MVGLVVAGLVVAGLGVASATVWRPSDTAVMTTGAVSASADATGETLLTTAPGVLSLVDEDVTITARSSDDATVVLALGSQVDVEGWVGEDPSRVVTGASDWETLTVDERTAATDEAATDEAATDEAATDEAATDDAAAEPVAPGPDPSGSDMWVESTSGTGSASLRWDATSTDQVLLVAAVGEDAAAPQLTLSWPREVTTPLLWPGVALGVLLVVLGLLYGLLTARRRSRSASATARRTPAAASTTSETAPVTGTLTRRQLREQAEREEQEATEAAARPKRQWPWTGAIPVVKPAGEQDTADDATSPAETAPEPHRPAWLPEGTGSTSGSSWRAAWGVRTPDDATTAASSTMPSASPDDATDDAAPGGPTPDGPRPGRPAPGSSTPAGGEPATGASAAPAATASARAAAAPRPASAPSSGQPSGTSPTGGPSEAPSVAPSTSPSAAPSTTPSSRPGAPSGAGSSTPLPPVRPVDPSSPFQRITLRSGDESAPARRIRREQQPSAWSAPRSPWAQPARPPVDPTTGPGTTAAGSTDAPAPTDDTTKDSE